MREDMVTWLRFLEHLNGVVYFPERQWTTTDTLQLFTDSAGSAGLGCGCYFQGQWVFLQWPDSWAYTQILRDITFLELVLIVLALHIWDEALQKQKSIQFKAQHILGIDNKIADAISRKQCEFFRRIAPNADKDPQPIPRPFQLLLLLQTK